MQILEKPKNESADGEKKSIKAIDNKLLPDPQKEAEIAGIPPIIAGIPPIIEGSPLRDSKEKELHQEIKSPEAKTKSQEIGKELEKYLEPGFPKSQEQKTNFKERESDTKEEESNTGSTLSKTVNFSSAIVNLFSAGTLIASLAKEFFNGEVTFLGHKKGHEDDFAYGYKKLSEEQLPEGEKIGWLSFKLGSLINALGSLSKYLNTVNPLGIFGGLLSLVAVPIQEKITGTLMNTIAFSMVAIGLGKEGDPNHFKSKKDRGYADTLFNMRKIADEVSDSFQDVIEFCKNPFKHLPHKAEAETKVLMNFIAYVNTIAATGGILGRAFGSKAMNRFFVKIDKLSTAFQSITELIQGVKEKWRSSNPDTAARTSALYQVLGALVFTPAALIYDSKLGKALNALASGFYGLHAALTSIPGTHFNDSGSKIAKNLSSKSNITAIGASVLGIITGLFFTQKESSNNPINKLLKIIEFNNK